MFTPKSKGVTVTNPPTPVLPKINCDQSGVTLCVDWANCDRTFEKGLVIADAVTKDQFHIFCEENPKLHVYFQHGSIILEELTQSPCHGGAIQSIQSQIRTYNSNLTGDAISPVLSTSDSAFNFGSDIDKAPDVAVLVRGRNNGRPTVVIEVGYSNGIAFLHDHKDLYLRSAVDNGVREYVFVKIMRPYNINNPSLFRALAVRYVRQPTFPFPSQVISFGTLPCTHLHRSYISRLMNIPMDSTRFSGYWMGEEFPPCTQQTTDQYNMIFSPQTIFTLSEEDDDFRINDIIPPAFELSLFHVQREIRVGMEIMSDNFNPAVGERTHPDDHLQT